MINKLKRLHIGRGLISQYLLVFFAFLLMVMIGDYYAGNLVNKYLATYGDDVVIISADTLESYLEGYQYTFEDMVYFIQDMYGANPNAENINDELVKWNARLYATDKRYQDYLFIYGLIGDEFMYGLDWDIPLDYDPKSRPWYIGAYENYGELFYCDPYVDMRTGEWVISISKVLIDANDNPFGVLAFDFYLTSIGNYVVNLKLLDNGYGVLLDSNMNFIIHPEPSVFGMKLDDIQPEKAVLMRSNDSISAYRYNSVTGVDSVMFGRKLFNGWYLYVASPYDDFYRDINTMFIVLSFTAFMFTLMLCGILTFMHHAKHHSDEEKKRAKSLLDAAPLGAMIWDRNLKLFDCNQETVKLFGLKDELDFINRIAELSPLYQSDGVLSSEKSVAYLLKALDEGKHVFEWTHQCPDGTPIPAEITLVRVNYSNDIAIAAYVRDLRLHKQMMTEIENQNNIISAEKHRIEELAHFYESILDAIPSLITVTDADKNRIFVNKAIEDILDTRMKDLIGKQCSTFNADICGSEDCGIERAKRGKKKTYFKHNERTYQAITEILKDMDGITTGYIEFAQDITSLQDTAWRLEEALTEAQKANQGKSDFLSSMSHEIRTPMNIILGMTELMLLEPLNDKQLDYINDIKMSAKSLLAIINDILDMSKIEAGKSKLLPVNYHFHALLKHIKAIFSYAAKNKNIDFYVESEPHLPKILFGDDIRLLQVLTNIINNAIKFTHKGYVKLRVTTEESQLLFEVIDTGIGIREEDIANLFNAFMQVDIHKNRGVVGTGLGLTISKSFVEMMGGSISIESEYGRGTVFRILIPMVKGTEEDLHTELETRETEPLYAPDAKVLVVDDNEFNLKVAYNMLKISHVDVDLALSGKEAIEKVLQEDYDLIFMDHMMPEMDGAEATAAIRNLGEKYKKLPIIAITANAVVGVKEMLFNSGLNDFIPKPVCIADLTDILRKWLKPEKIVTEVVLGENPEEQADDFSDNDFIKELRKIKEVDVDKGLLHVDGNTAIYQSTVEIFIRNLLPECRKTDELLRENKISNFGIAVHAVKSMLSTIGAMELSDTALLLELAAKEEEPDLDYIHNNFPIFMEKLKVLHGQLAGIFDAANYAVR